MISRSLPRPLLRVLPHPVLSVLLLLVWLLLVDSFAIGHWLLGAFLGVCIPLLTNRLLVGRSQEWHPLLLLKLLVLVMWDILVANVQVARLTLGPIQRLRPAFVEVPIELENDLAISVLVSIVSLTPGSVSSDLSGADRRDQATLRSAAEGDLPMLAYVIPLCLALLGLALLLTLARLVKGPCLPDRALALDTLYVNAIALLVLYGIWRDSDLFFEAALLIAVLGFVGTVAVAKYMLRGDIIE